MKIGIMGGTFNPIHIGHLILAESAREELSLDTVLFMPSKRPPHKENDTIISEDLRCAMTQAAIKGNHAFYLSDIEIKRMKTTYTVDTLRQLEGEGEIYFIMGADSLADMEKWYAAFLQTDKAKECIEAFDRVMPDYKHISSIKKIDSILWSIR